MSFAAAASALNRHAKWAVAGSTFVTVVVRQDDASATFMLGALLNAAFGKVAKRVVNDARPRGSRKADPGMPSSHAMSLSYFTVHLTALALRHWSAPAALPVLLLTTGFTYTVCYARVEVDGDHRWDQVAVGATLGALFALGWMWAVPV